jgi:Uma2 family endonuclease
MSEALQHRRPRLTVDTYRSWSALRPDNERWELLDGVPVMMNPPTMRHQRIAHNLNALLNAGLKVANRRLEAFQRVGLNLGVEYYDPEPDVAVVDRPTQDDQRYADRFYLAAEVVSDSDRRTLEDKCRLYRAHEHCRCILIVRQDRCEVVRELRRPGGWTRTVLDQPEAELVLEEFGLLCHVRDLYAEP